jgi:hypothetical protein
MTTITDTMEALEAVVDRVGIKNVVELLAIICQEKAEHIRTNWQDHTTAAVWTRNAATLDGIASKVER